MEVYSVSAIDRIRKLHADTTETLKRPLPNAAREAFGGLAVGLDFAARAIEEDWRNPASEPAADIRHSVGRSIQ
jgi:hypothetical protein